MSTIWAGVRNPLAQKHLHAVKKGDRIFYYHTGDEKAVIGIAKAASDAYPDPKDKSGKAAVVDVAPVRKLTRPVTLAEIKADARSKTRLIEPRRPRPSVTGSGRLLPANGSARSSTSRTARPRRPASSPYSARGMRPRR